MLRLILIITLLLASLLCIVKAPIFYFWYLQIIVTEFSWIFILIQIILISFNFYAKSYRLPSSILGLFSIALFCYPLIIATKISGTLTQHLSTAFGNHKLIQHKSPFDLLNITGLNGEKQLKPSILTYDTVNNLTLDFYPSLKNETAPCIIVVHGGSWSGGDSKQLPELNSHLANNGYQVVSINYRLAPEFKSPAPNEDIQKTIKYLTSRAAELKIDSNSFFLLGRSAGAQIVLAQAYGINDPKIKGVINFYGPADMIWGYQHPASKLIMDSKKVMEDFLGGTYNQVPQNYLASSPVELNARKVPTLIIHGENDPLVAYEHSKKLIAKLKQNNTPYYLLSLPWATHGCDYSLNGPSGQLSTFAVDYFLNCYKN